MKNTIYRINDTQIKIILENYSCILLKILKNNKKIDIKIDDERKHYILINNTEQKKFKLIKEILNYCTIYKKYDCDKINDNNIKIEAKNIIKLYKYINYLNDLSNKYELFVTIDNDKLLYPCFLYDNDLMINKDFYLDISDKRTLPDIQYVKYFIVCKKYELNNFNENEFFI